MRILHCNAETPDVSNGVNFCVDLFRHFTNQIATHGKYNNTTMALQLQTYHFLPISFQPPGHR
jgi:hypothetical protein